MIKYSLQCQDSKTVFEGWFKSASDYDQQKANNFISCPVCGSLNVEKQLMAPNISTSERRSKIIEEANKIKKYIDQNFEDVGSNFAEEVIAIHEGTAEDRAIRGKISSKDVKKLNEMKLPYLIIPNFKEDA